jgi:RNA polymerase sigma-70 factor (ECF subfamily)
MTEQPAVEQYSDAELLERAKRNPDEFGAIVGKYWDPLFRYVRRIAQIAPEEIEDILQETFIKTYRKLYEYEPDIRFSSFIYRVAHNQTIDHFRRTNARPRNVYLDEEEWRKLFVSAVSSEQEFLTKDCLEKIRIALGNIPKRYREALVLRFLEEKDYGEIMDILEKPKGSVATLIARGRKLLLEELKRQNVECFHETI